ncbi:MAG: glycosyltransferase [Sandaracinaceae bacterium]
MGVLHVAAMPFPSVQGTQAAVRMMVDAEHAAGLRPELCTYAHGGYELEPPWPVHRVADLVRDRSLASGPSWRKVVADAQLVIETRRLATRMQPAYVVAHHVEAAAAALAARVGPLVFFAHTALGPELPTYLPARAAGLAARAGEALDVTLTQRADRAAAVCPALAERLSARAARDVRYVPIPWPVASPTDVEERAKARARLALDPADAVILYAGNLDAYQGLDVLPRAFAALHHRRPDARLVIATRADRDAIERALFEASIAASVTFAPIDDEPDRRMAHAACDVAWVPRGAEGGLPMKLLDALARGVPTVVTRRATGGLDLGDAALVTADDDPDALAAATLTLLEGRGEARAIGARGAAYVREHHSAARYLDAMRGLSAGL